MNRTLTLRRLGLRAPRPGDADAAHARWAADPVVHRWLGHRPSADLEQTRRLLAWDEACWLKRSAYTWLLVPHGDVSPVGLLRLVPAAGVAPPHHHLRLGLVLARSHQGRGLMREAVAGLLAHALAQPEVWRVDAVCDVDNAASQRLFQALGLVNEGRLARHSLHPNVSDQPRDVWLFAAVRAEAPNTPALPAAGPAGLQPPTTSIGTFTPAGGAQ